MNFLAKAVGAWILNTEKKISDDSGFLKLFSHHGYFIYQGLAEDVSDFVLPGSIIKFNKKKPLNYDLSWFLNFDQFCTRDDHENVAKDLSESFPIASVTNSCTKNLGSVL